eukprot:CAMPEP_0178378670 /NCGR_PEP_ID=MMETSP0689_2-20121128/4548_1 /TAXON_ID=160604 /ORGANISM="Amphidinium massartii, Strain CS-259" /LENGTH=318 /DNA_ID=CAMNT_0019998751 /DNA_START=9 /DNA_END=965 /DNA_ORIENTATION=-
MSFAAGTFSKSASPAYRQAWPLPPQPAFYPVGAVPPPPCAPGQWTPTPPPSASGRASSPAKMPSKTSTSSKAGSMLRPSNPAGSEGPPLRQTMAVDDLEKVSGAVAEPLKKHIIDLLEREPPPPVFAAAYVPCEDRAVSSTSVDAGDPSRPPLKRRKMDATPSCSHEAQTSNVFEGFSMVVDDDMKHGVAAATELILRRKLERAREGDRVQLTINQIRFSQESIKGSFSDGREVKLMIEELATGKKTLNDIPPITVVIHNGEIYSADNRRLFVFKQSGMPPETRIPVIVGRSNAAFSRKLTTPSDGESLRRRADDGFV